MKRKTKSNGKPLPVYWDSRSPNEFTFEIKVLGVVMIPEDAPMSKSSESWCLKKTHETHVSKII